MDGKDQSSLNNHESSGGKDDCSTDDEYHSDNEDRKLGQTLGKGNYRHYKPLAKPTDEDLAICLKAIAEDASPNDKLAMKQLLCGISDGTRLASLLMRVIPTCSETWHEEDWRELIHPLGAVLLQKDDNGCNACHHVFLDRLSSTRSSAQEPSLTANIILKAVFEQDKDKINEPTGKMFKSRTCLHLAADPAGWGRFRITFDRLLEMGADTTKPDDDGNTVWEIVFAQIDAFAMRKLYAIHEVAAFMDTDKAKRHWLRAWEVTLPRGRILAKYDGLLADLRKPPDQLFTVAANKRLWIQALLMRMCEIENVPAYGVIAFVQKHFLEHRSLSTGLRMREPDVAFGLVNSKHLLSIAMPYFYSGTLHSVYNRDKLHEKKTKSRTCPDGKRGTHGLHLPLTLDEYCNSTLDKVTLDERNQDQVLVRYAMKQRDANRLGNSREGGKIPPETRLLMVHQVWIYGFGSNFIVAFPEVVQREDSILEALTRRWTPWKGKPIDFLLHIAEWLTAFVGLLEIHSCLNRPALDIYEESISALSKDVDSYFNKSIEEQEKAADDEKQYFHVIADIREELSMIQSVVTQQDRVWTDLKAEILANWSDDTNQHENEESKLAAEASPKRPKKENMKITDKMSLRLQNLKDRIDRADRNAERVQNLIPQYLELKRSYTAMKESHYTALLGAAVFGFSVVTIIFVPMSFILALLAVPEDSLLVGSVRAERKRYFVGKWTGVTEGTSLGVTIVVMIFAWCAFKKQSEFRDSKGKNAARSGKKQRNDTTSNASDAASADGHRASAGSEAPVTTGGVLRGIFRSMLRGTRKRTDVEQGHGARNPDSEIRN